MGEERSGLHHHVLEDQTRPRELSHGVVRGISQAEPHPDFTKGQINGQQEVVSTARWGISHVGRDAAVPISGTEAAHSDASSQQRAAGISQGKPDLASHNNLPPKPGKHTAHSESLSAARRGISHVNTTPIPLVPTARSDDFSSQA